MALCPGKGGLGTVIISCQGVEESRCGRQRKRLGAEFRRAEELGERVRGGESEAPGLAATTEAGAWASLGVETCKSLVCHL